MAGRQIRKIEMDKKNNMTKAVIFDMYETLITHYNCPLYFGAEMAADAGVTKEEFFRIWRNDEYEWMRTVGRMTLEELLAMTLKDVGKFSPELVEKLAGKRVTTKVECFNHLHPQIIPMLEELKKQGLKIGLISNCYFEEAKVIRDSELFPYFDTVCLSCELGMRKPEEAIYERCMQELNVIPEECVYVGDGGSYELETARRIGMKPVQATWYFKEGTTQPTGPKKEFLQAKEPMDVIGFLERQI